MKGSSKVVPFSLRDAPALIERIFPAQKLSAESYTEQMAGTGKTLTSLGSYWKGRKPLILSKACVLGALLPATDNLKRDLDVFEKLMAMDDVSFVVRIGRIKPAEIVERVELEDIGQFFLVEPEGLLPKKTPFRIADYPIEGGKLPRIKWRNELSDLEMRKIEALALPVLSYHDLVSTSDRPEVCGPDINVHIWDDVNEHLGTAERVNDFETLPVRI